MNGTQRSLTPDEILPAEGASSASAITPKFAFDVLRRWWKLSLALGLVLAAAAGLFVHFSYVPLYEAQTWLRITPNSHLVYPTGYDHNLFVRTQQELIRSPIVLAEALAEPEVSSSPAFRGVEDRIAWLKSRVVASPVNGSELFVIGLSSPHQESVHKIVNAIRNAYLATLNARLVTESDSRLKLLDAERLRRYNQIQEDRERLKELNKQRSVAGGGEGMALGEGGERGGSTPLLSEVVVLQSELQRAEIDQIMAEAEVETTKGMMARAKEIVVSDEAVRQEVEGSEVVIALLARQARLAKELEEQKRVLSPARLQEREGALAAVAQELQGRREELEPVVRAGLLDQAKEQRAEQLQIKEAKVQQQKLLADVLRQRLEAAKRRAQDRGETSLEFEFLAQDHRRRQAVYDRICDQVEIIKTELRAPNLVTVYHEAKPSLAAVGAGPTKKAGMAAGAMLLLPFAGFFLWELRSRRIADVADFSSVAQLRIVGEIATLPVKSRLMPRAEQRFEETLSRFEESIDYLRTAVMIAQRGSGIRSLVICSATSREGKTTVSAHLASSLIRGVEGKVLLIDADLRRPHLHRLLGVENGAGMVDYLSLRRTEEEVICPTWVDGLDFVPAGVLDASAGTLLASGRFERFLESVRDRYAFIVIDVPPVLPVSDALVVARAADAAVMVGLRDFTTASNVARAVAKLRDAQVNVIGGVFNGVPASHYGAGYYYYRVRPPASPVATAT